LAGDTTERSGFARPASTGVTSASSFFSPRRASRPCSQRFLFNERPFWLNEKPLPFNGKPFRLDKKPFPFNEKPLPLNKKGLSSSKKGLSFNQKPFPLNKKGLPSSKKGLWFNKKPLPLNKKGRRQSSGQDLHVSVGSMHADALPILDQPGRVLHADDRRQAVFAGDHRAVGHQPTHLGHQAPDGHKHGRPARVCEGGDQDVPRFQLGFGHVREDAGSSLDDARGDGETDQ